MNKQTVYVPTKVVDEGFYHTKEFCLDSYGGKRLMNYLGNGEWVDEGGVTDNITHWLKSTEAYVFTPEEFEQLLSDAFNAGHNRGYNLACCEAVNSDCLTPTKEEYIENLLNKEK